MIVADARSNAVVRLRFNSCVDMLFWIQVSLPM